MNDDSLFLRPRLRVLTPLLGAALAIAGPVSASAATPTPSPTASAGVQLPLIASSLDAGHAVCTKASETQVGAVSWAQQRLGLAQANRYSQGKGVRVAVVGTGVSPKAVGLSGRVEADGAAAEDCVGHGTFLAGVIGASAVPGSGFAGVAPQARLLAERGTDQWGVPSTALTAQGIEAAVDGGADVVLVSAALSKDTGALRAAVEHAADKDVLLVAPAAPDTAPKSTSAQASDPPPSDYWPAAADGVLSVVGVDIVGDRPQDVPQPLHADLAAPGVAVTGIGPAGKGNYVANGSSVAAAFAAGTAALVRAHQPDLTAAQTAARLRATAAHAPVPLLDPTAALSTVLDPSAPSPAPEGAVNLPEAAPRSAVVPRAWTLAGVSLLLIMVAGGVMALAKVRASRRTPGGDPA